MRMIDADALCRVLNDHWLATSPRDTDTKAVAEERAAMCRGLDDAMHIAEQMPTIGGWISVKDRLPTIGEDVLVHFIDKTSKESGFAITDVIDNLYYGSYESIKVNPTWERPWQYFFDNNEITHWMPLPEPPKEDT